MVFTRVGTVRIMHPGSSRLILPLPTFPNLSAPDTTTPLAPTPHHRLILDACRVVTNNAVKADDYLSRDRAGQDRVLTPSPNNTLAPGEYFYHPGPPSAPTIPNYPIVTDFAAWNFPEKIPDHWVRPSASTQEIGHLQRKYGWCKPSDMTLAVKFGDTSCIVTGMSLVAGLAVHLVPPSHEQWFHRNCMTRYNWAGPGTGISDPANGIALRADVAHLWGVNAFLLVPAGQQGGFMTYVTMPRLGLAQEFHRRWVPISQRVSDAFLYARFAYTIITLVAKLGDKKLDAFPLPKGVKPSRRGALLKLRPGDYVDNGHDCG